MYLLTKKSLKCICKFSFVCVWAPNLSWLMQPLFACFFAFLKASLVDWGNPFSIVDQYFSIFSMFLRISGEDAVSSVLFLPLSLLWRVKWVTCFLNSFFSFSFNELLFKVFFNLSLKCFKSSLICTFSPKIERTILSSCKV